MRSQTSILSHLWETWLFCASLAGVCAYATEETLEKCQSHRLIVIVAVISCATSLIGLLILALVRGDILLLYLHTVMAAGLGDGAAAGSSTSTDVARFYESAAWELRLFFGLLAVATELASGLAIYEARKIAGPPPDVLETLEGRVRFLEAEMIALLHRIEFLKREPEIFASGFNRDFYLGLVQGAARRTLRHGSMIGALAVIGLTLVTGALAQPVNAVIAVDLTLSSAAENYDGTAEHTKNIEAIARLMEDLPAAARFNVMGITDQSFSRPLILLSGQFPKDRGPLEFIDQAAVAGKRFAGRMRDIGRTTTPKYPQTDVLGFLLVAADLLREQPHSRKVLVILSDMRHSAPAPDIETPHVIPVTGALHTVAVQNQIADLHGVDVYVYGAHAAGKDIRYWQSLREFWQEYFSRSEANLKAFSMMRDVPDLAQRSATDKGR